MAQKMNYINALPDFLAMQRVSFCWFITQGLNEELALFSKIHDFSQNTEYIMFSEEYNLIKPPYSLLIARKYSGNYRAQLVIPIEVRNKTINSIRYHNQFPIITLPLMTTYATFIINGCERVIVSQIIRSPGIYFEKPKNQKTQKHFKRKLSTDINKLRSFLPSGEAFISESNLFFAIPTFTYDKVKKRKKLIPNWNSNTIYYYSIEYLKKYNQKSTFYLLESFKFYQFILKNLRSTSKKQLIQLFFKWLKLKTQLQNFQLDIEENNIKDLLNYFQFISTLLIKYELCTVNSRFMSTIISSSSLSVLLIKWNFSKTQLNKLVQNYTQVLFDSQINAQLQVNSKLILTLKTTNQSLYDLKNFQFLKINFTNTVTKINEIIQLVESSTLRPTIYFSNSLKDQFKYVFGKDKFIYKNERHNYLKTKTQFLLYKKDHQIKTNYHKKYEEKDLYSATLIPEYGSWIRFGFQKNMRLNPYKYPIKNQEDEIIIQLDKINQKSVLSLLKEMGLTDLEIYQNLQHADFFYFTQPSLIISKSFPQPISRDNWVVDDRDSPRPPRFTNPNPTHSHTRICTLWDYSAPPSFTTSTSQLYKA